MATHFARGTLTEGHLVSARLSSACHSEALKLPEHRRTRFLASRALLAELLFMLYGTSELPDILTVARFLRTRHSPIFPLRTPATLLASR